MGRSPAWPTLCNTPSLQAPVTSVGSCLFLQSLPFPDPWGGPLSAPQWGLPTPISREARLWLAARPWPSPCADSALLRLVELRVSSGSRLVLHLQQGAWPPRMLSVAWSERRECWASGLLTAASWCQPRHWILAPLCLRSQRTSLCWVYLCDRQCPEDLTCMLGLYQCPLQPAWTHSFGGDHLLHTLLL